jgi:hypothetical protein
MDSLLHSIIWRAWSHGSGKKQLVQRCKHTTQGVKTRLEQEMCNTLRSVAENKTSGLEPFVRRAVRSTEFMLTSSSRCSRGSATLRANDSEVPGMPDIYFRMSRPACFKFPAAERTVVLEAYSQQGDMLYNRLHALGFVLNAHPPFEEQVRRELHASVRSALHGRAAPSEPIQWLRRHAIMSRELP